MNSMTTTLSQSNQCGIVFQIPRWPANIFSYNFFVYKLQKGYTEVLGPVWSGAILLFCSFGGGSRGTGVTLPPVSEALSPFLTVAKGLETNCLSNVSLSRFRLTVLTLPGRYSHVFVLLRPFHLHGVAWVKVSVAGCWLWRGKGSKWPCDCLQPVPGICVCHSLALDCGGDRGGQALLSFLSTRIPPFDEVETL